MAISIVLLISTFEAEQLLGAVVTYGLPFMESFISYEDVISGCERYGYRHLNAARVPALRSLASKKR